MFKLSIAVCLAIILLLACKKNNVPSNPVVNQISYSYDAYTDTIIKYFQQQSGGYLSYIYNKVKADTFNKDFQFIAAGDFFDIATMDTFSFHAMVNRQFQRGYNIGPMSLTDSNTSLNRLIFSRGYFPTDFNENTNVATYLNNYLVDDFSFLKLSWSHDSLNFKYIRMSVDTFSVNNFKIITTRSEAIDGLQWGPPLYVPEK